MSTMKMKNNETKDAFIMSFYESYGEDLWENPAGEELIMLWTWGESLDNKKELEINSNIAYVQFIRV